jgi:hypothetical protein
MEPTVLVFNQELKQTEIGGTKEADDIRAAKDAILQYLDALEDPVGEPAIRDDVEGRTKIISKALRELVAGKDVERQGAGTRGSPFLYSRILVPTISTEQEKQEESQTI